ncbi:MAG TPA: hypothetical protein VMG12_44160, partial [Polyangiaceae bacterium]|nr:hypothetical protein [Polyangiaceae bacterium]
MSEKKAVVRHAHSALEGARRALEAKMSRRVALKGVGLGLGLIAGCSDDGAGDPSTAGTGGSNAGGSGGSGGTPNGSAGGTGSATAWATGGTAAMLAAASY